MITIPHSVHHAVFLNRGTEAREPRFMLAGLPAGDYAACRIDPDADERPLGRQSAESLAQGLSVGPLQPDRMAAVRLERLP